MTGRSGGLAQARQVAAEAPQAAARPEASEGRHDVATARHEPAEEPQEMLEDVRREIILLLAELPRLPSTLRVQASGVAVELAWNGGTHGTGAAAGTTAPGGDAAAGDGDEGSDASTHYVCAPTVGVFYRAPQPGAKPFVAEGGMVSAGEQVAIVEAMKLFLPVEADQSGRVARFLVADGSSVEFGERLIAIETTGS
jgi:acetyl-CoA carboxylase biotin carboxyl carrier protein